MLPLWTEHWGNAGSGHAFGRPVGQAVNAARRTVAAAAPEDRAMLDAYVRGVNATLRMIRARRPLSPEE